jgi:dolichol-phosphate mannosyltransferase
MLRVVIYVAIRLSLEYRVSNAITAQGAVSPAVSSHLLKLLRTPGGGEEFVPNESSQGVFLQSSTLRVPVIDGIPVFVDPPAASAHGYDLSVVILTKNEGRNIAVVLQDLKTAIESLAVSSEIIVVDGGSSDETVEQARREGARVITQTVPGYASGIAEGFRAAQGRFVATLDGDCSHPGNLLPLLWSRREKADVVIGSRWVPGGSFNGPKVRGLLSRTLNHVFRRILAIPVADLSSGYRLYSRRVLENQKYRCQDFSVLEEIIVQATNEGFTIEEVPLQFFPRNSGRSNVQLAKFALSFSKALYLLWKIRRDAGACDYDHRAFDSLNLVQRWWQRSRYANIMGWLQPFLRSGEVLDIGCGSSRIIQSLPHAVAFDLSLRKLRYLARSNPLRVCGSSFELPFADGVFDAVVHSQLIEHLPKAPKIFTELRRVIRPGGTLILGTVDYSSKLWPTIEKIYGWLMPFAYADEHCSHYTRAELLELLPRYGFQPQDIRTIVGAEITIRAVAK